MSSYHVRSKVAIGTVPNAAAGKLNEFVDAADGLAKSKDDAGNIQVYSGTASIVAHVAAADPHPQYLTPAEGNAAYVPVSHTTGQVNSHTQIDTHIANTSNPHGTTAAQVGAAPTSHIGSGGSQHADATTSVSGFMSGADKTKLNSITYKTGIVAAVSFTGTPRKATVTFASALPSTNYTITACGVNARTWSFESKTTSGFVINTNANAALSGEVNWQVFPVGEVG